MKITLIAVIASMLISMTCNAKEVTFYVGQAHGDWALNIVGKGKAVVGETLVYAEYEYVKFTNNPKYNKNQRVRYISLGYAHYLPNGKWERTGSGGVRHEINRTLKPNESMSVHWYDSKLKSREKQPEDYWIVVTIATDSGFVYAHSRRDIFK